MYRDGILPLARRRIGRIRRFGAGLSLLALSLGGCTGFFPSQGPDSSIVNSPRAADPDKVQYALVNVTPAVLAALQDAPVDQFGPRSTAQRPPPEIRLGVGDVIGVTLFEASAGGLFIPQEAGSRAGNFVTLPNQEVDLHGNVTVPYAGVVRAQNKSPAEVKALIEDRLRNRAIEPQAIVSLVQGRSREVSVTGEANASLRYTPDPSGERILDAIARAGGPKYPIFETYVTLKRGSQTWRTYFNNLVREKLNNVYLYPGDSVILDRQFRSFMALGASGQNGQINFDNETLTLAQAMGKAGGILDTRGDPAQTFVYRLEPKRVVAEMGVDTTPYLAPKVPVIYRIDFREPDGLFLASKFAMDDRDILFVSNAGSAELSKILNLVALGTAGFYNASLAAATLK